MMPDARHSCPLAKASNQIGFALARRIRTVYATIGGMILKGLEVFHIPPDPAEDCTDAPHRALRPTLARPRPRR